MKLKCKLTFDLDNAVLSVWFRDKSIPSNARLLWKMLEKKKNGFFLTSNSKQKNKVLTFLNRIIVLEFI